MGWTVRDSGGPPPSYDKCLGEFTIKMHYGGTVEGSNYVGGKFGFIDYCHEDEIGIIELCNMATEVGTTFSNDYYLNTNEGFTIIKCDNDALKLCQLVGTSREVGVYAVCNIPHYVPTQCSQAGLQVDVEIEQNEIPQDSDEYDPESTSESECSEFEESDGDLEADDALFETTVDPNIEFAGLGDHNAAGDEGGHGLDDLDDEVGHGFCHLDDDSDNSDELHSGSSSDTDNDGSKVVKKKYAKFNEEADMLNPVFIVGMEFKTHIIFRDAVKEHAIKFGRKIRFVKSERRKVSAVCSGKVDCPWYIYASLVDSEGLYRIKRYESEHTCARSYNVPWVSTKWIMKRYGDRISKNPTWPIQSLAETIEAEHTVHVDKQKCFRAKRKVLDILEGDAAQQFRELFAYINEVKSTNPGTTIKVKCKAVTGSDFEYKFKCLYLCWGSLKKGFLEGCRPVIGLDGCHLKGPYGGILLTAVGLDANNCIYPFAYAVVGKEKRKTWLWFLENLKEDLDVQNTHRYTFMTDKQKGLIDAVGELFPNAAHRFCVRHMYNNFKGEFKGLVLKDLLWKAARSSTVPKFKSAMEEIKAVDPNAFQWLNARPPANWSRSHFDTFPKCDILLNNLCESFNSAILSARDKPIIGMLERIRMTLMETIQKRHTVMLRCKEKICPKIKKRVDKLREDKGWLPRYFGNEQFQVEGPNDQYKVDLKTKTCGCRRWELSGIPCVHAIAALTKLDRDPMDHISKCYSVDTYLKTYANVLGPINGRAMWEDSGDRILLPPDVKRRAGRPKKVRRREPDEPVVAPDPTRLGRKGVVRMTCSICKQVGHNRRGCKGSTAEANATGEASSAGQRKRGGLNAGQGRRGRRGGLNAWQRGGLNAGQRGGLNARQRGGLTAGQRKTNAANEASNAMEQSVVTTGVTTTSSIRKSTGQA